MTNFLNHRDYSKVLHELANVIVLILLEPSVPDLPEGGQLVRSGYFLIFLSFHERHNFAEP